MYKTIVRFTDLQDNGHRYNVGDVFPRIGQTVSESRLEELSTNKNKRGMPLIEFVGVKPEATEESKDAIKDEARKPTKTEINRMPVAELRALAAEKGLENPDEHTGAELKEWLIENM